MIRGFWKFGQEIMKIPDIQIRAFTGITGIYSPILDSVEDKKSRYLFRESADYFFYVWAGEARVGEIPVSDFLLKGLVPQTDEVLRRLTRGTLGSPEEVKPPVIREWKPSPFRSMSALNST